MGNYYNTKVCSLSIKDISEKDGIVSGYFSSFGNQDSDGDIIEHGAFTKTITERGPQSSKPRIKHLLDHYTSKAIGVLQELKEDSKGLFYVSKLGGHTLGRDALHMYMDGIITEHSIGFETIKATEDKSNKIIRLKELKLWEGSSLQTWGANPETPVNGVKGIGKKPHEYIERINVITKALRNGKYTDETFELLEIELKQIQEVINNLLQKPDDSTYKKESSEDILKYFRESLIN